jgi:hypothetical protein
MSALMLAEITTGSWWMIVLAWVLSLGAMGGYAVSVIRRGRRLSRQVPVESRRWM